MPPSKTCSQIRFLIFRHPLVPLFEQSRKSDPSFLSVKVNHCLCIETSQIRKTTKGPPFERKKMSLISLKFHVWDPLTIKISNFGVLCYFSNALGPQINFNVKTFKFFGRKCQKWLYWVLANTKRNKVMNFGEPSPCSVDTVHGFMVERVKKTPLSGIWLNRRDP